MFFVIYEILLYLVALLSVPKLLYSLVVLKKYRHSLLPRLGFGLPPLQKKGRFCIWVHAVSVGETKAVAPLVKKLREQSPNAFIIISSITETGHEEAKRSLPFADRYLFLPFDFSWLVGRIIRKAEPDLVMITETDFWLNFQRAAKKSGAKVVLVNGKISLRSLHRHQKIPFIAKYLFSSFDLLCMQSSLYMERFAAMGLPKEKMVVTGNLKLCDEYPHFTPQERAAFKKKMGFGNDDSVVVIGSTHAPEEELLMLELRKVWEKEPQMKVILVPRHPERCPEIIAVLKEEKRSFVLYSQISDKDGGERVVLVDTMGVLRQCYQIADLAIVAGSFTPKIGGHNILEPCWYGVPVLCGPYMFSQPEFLELLLEFGAGEQLPMDQVGDRALSLLQNPYSSREMGDAGVRAVHSAKGAVDQTFSHLSLLLSE